MRNFFDADSRMREANNKAMNPDQFDQVVKAIIEGKYSWACVLILRFAGYNPAHYIPYRTYKRLVKSNRPSQTALTAPSNEHQSVKPRSLSAS